jgi:hypothetical protein
MKQPQPPSEKIARAIFLSLLVAVFVLGLVEYWRGE